MICVDFPKALELNFSCFACGGMVEPLNNQEKIKTLNSEINLLSETIGVLKQKLNEF